MLVGTTAVLAARGDGPDRPSVNEWLPKWRAFHATTVHISEEMVRYATEFERNQGNLSKGAPAVVELYRYCGRVVAELQGSQRVLTPAPNKAIDHALAGYFHAALHPYQECASHGYGGVTKGNAVADRWLRDAEAAVARLNHR